RYARMLLEIRAQHFVHYRLDRAFHFGVAELGLGLTFELRLANFYGENCGQSFTDVVSGKSDVTAFAPRILGRVSVDRTRERRLESREVCSTFVRVDVVHEGENVLGVAVVVLKRELDFDIVALSLDIYDLVVQRLASGVEKLNHLLESALCEERLGFFLALALILDANLHSLVEEGELAQAI